MSPIIYLSCPVCVPFVEITKFPPPNDSKVYPSSSMLNGWGTIVPGQFKELLSSKVNIYPSPLFTVSLGAALEDDTLNTTTSLTDKLPSS